MISIKSEHEINMMREASKILIETREALRDMIKPGISTRALDVRAEEVIRSYGAVPSFKDYEGYPASICASINHVVIHGIPNDQEKLKEGDIISIDLGVFYKGYHADSAATFAVGEISNEKAQLMKVTEEALFKGIEMAMPGNHVSDISHAIESYIKPYGYGIVETFTGHGIGRQLHEEPQVLNYGPKGQGPILRPGMTICIEPMVNLGSKNVKVLSDGWTVVTTDKKPSAHAEHMILITQDGHEIMTKKKE